MELEEIGSRTSWICITTRGPRWRI